MSHVFRQHKKEADHWANVGELVERRKLWWIKEVMLCCVYVDSHTRVLCKVENCKRPENADGSCKENGRIGCGVVILG